MYNSEMFIADTIEMLMKQDLNNCEIIIINDGSSDKSEKICSEYCKKFDKIKLITIPHAGVSASRNTGIEYAAGKYLYFFDSDDSLPDGTILFFKEKINEYFGVNILAFGYEMLRNRRLVKQYVYKTCTNILFKRLDYFIKLFYSKKISCHLGSILLEHDFIRKNRLKFRHGIMIGEDLEFILRSIHNADSVYYNERISFIYQLRDDSALQGYKKFRIEQCGVIPMLLDCIKELSNNHVGEEAYLYLANLYLLNLFYYLRSDTKNELVNKYFIENSDLLYKKVSGNFFRALIIFVSKHIPIKLILKLFRKDR
jgi:glycosyltransferase involved in cell wall biosynthesis